ncbi:MAG: hypothetical protein KKI08_14205 [Armatimonadetes bacterium]|nr:hypothetical protein [Armatimonadota bacterium]
MPRKKPTEKILCGAKNRSGNPCRQVAGMGTNHLGAGRCKYHGGATPIKHGMYSKIVTPEEMEAYGDFMREFDILQPTEGETFLLFRMLRYATGRLTVGETLEAQKQALRLGLEALRSLSLVRTRYAKLVKGRSFNVHFDTDLADYMLEAMADMIYRLVPPDRHTEAENMLWAIVREKSRLMDQADAV